MGYTVFQRFKTLLKTKLYNLNGTVCYIDGIDVILTGRAGNEVEFIADNAQQKLYFRCAPTNATGIIQVKFRAPLFAMKNFLGFNTEIPFRAAYDGNTRNVIGTDVAKFNREISYFITNCSLSDGSYDSSGNYNGSQIAQIFPVSISPGSLLVHIPYNPIKCQTSIAGQTISSCQFWVTNQSGVLRDMRGEEFSALVVLEY